MTWRFIKLRCLLMRAAICEWICVKFYDQCIRDTQRMYYLTETYPDLYWKFDGVNKLCRDMLKCHENGWNSVKGS